MGDMSRRRLLLAVLGLLLMACSISGKGAPPVARVPTVTRIPNSSAGPQATPEAISTLPVHYEVATTHTSTPTRASITPLPSQVPSEPITLDKQQAEEVAVLVDFIHAYNAAQLDKALALFSDSGGWSDCDYRKGMAVGGRGKSSVREWLRQSFRVHDHLEVSRIVVGREQEEALGVVYQRRTNDALQALGHPDGIEPQLATKVIFNYSGSHGKPIARILGFNNGPIGGSSKPCKVSPA